MVHRSRRLGHERGLAHPRLARDEDHTEAVLSGAALVEVPERRQLVGPAEEGEEALGRSGNQPGGEGKLRTFPGSGDLGGPADLDQLDRVGQTLQLHLPQRLELLGRMSPRQGPSDGRGQDLAALG
jgi:hypothetical protein